MCTTLSLSHGQGRPVPIEALGFSTVKVPPSSDSHRPLPAEACQQGLSFGRVSWPPGMLLGVGWHCQPPPFDALRGHDEFRSPPLLKSWSSRHRHRSRAPDRARLAATESPAFATKQAGCAGAFPRVASAGNCRKRPWLQPPGVVSHGRGSHRRGRQPQGAKPPPLALAAGPRP